LHNAPAWCPAMAFSATSLTTLHGSPSYTVRHVPRAIFECSQQRSPSYTGWLKMKSGMFPVPSLNALNNGPRLTLAG
jgi:hypothetical protein